MGERRASVQLRWSLRSRGLLRLRRSWIDFPKGESGGRDDGCLFGEGGEGEHKGG